MTTNTGSPWNNSRKVVDRSSEEAVMAVVVERPVTESEAVVQAVTPIMFDGDVIETVDQVREVLRTSIINEAFARYTESHPDTPRAEFERKFVLGENSTHEDAERIQAFNAHLNTRIARFFMNAQKRSNMAFRYHAFQMFIQGDEAWKFAEGIESFPKWLRAVAPEEWAASRYKPTMLFVTKILPFINMNEIVDDDEVLIDPPRMCSMYDKTMEAYAYAGSKLIDRILETEDEATQKELFMQFRTLTINALEMKANDFVSALKAGTATGGAGGDIITGMVARRLDADGEILFVIRATNQSVVNRIQATLASMHGDYELSTSMDEIHELLSLSDDDQELEEEVE